MSQMPSTSPAQLYLIIDASSSALARLKAVFARLRPPSLLIVPPVAGQNPDLDIARDLVAFAQAASVAALIAGNADMARGLKADGVHVDASDGELARYHEAREIVGGRSIVGVTVGGLRHDAMVAGEAGADYVGFDRSGGDLAGLVDRVAWWSEIFEVPCVAFGGHTREEWAELSNAGADFVAAACPPGASAADTVGFVEDAASAISEVVGG